MKKYYLPPTGLLLTVLFFFASCKKNPSPPPPTDELTITSWSPLRPYFGDELTITGTGFNADAAQNTVEFGGVPGQLVSATTTQIKVIVPVLEYGGILTPGSYTYLKVKANGKEVTATDYIYFPRPVSITTITSSSTNTAQMVPGDSITIEGGGFSASPSRNSVYFTTPGGSSPISRLIPVRVDSSFTTKMRCYYHVDDCLALYLNAQAATPETATELVDLVISVNGHTSRKLTRVNIFPKMPMVYLSHGTSNGNRFIRVRHKSILPGTMINWSGPVVTSTLLQTEYNNDVKETSFFGLVSNVPAGNYNISIVRNGVLYMTQSVTF
jgi:IPT/TIG domain